jgi:uncharacterized protein
MPEIADLPSSPCLSSRVETGIAIDPAILRAIDAVEEHLRAALPSLGLPSKNVRCRYRLRGVVIELDEAVLAQLNTAQRATLSARVSETFSACAPSAVVRFEPYRLGSAFLHPVKLVR